MSTAINDAIAAITAQQKGHDEDRIFYVGEQLKDICRHSESNAALVCEDFRNPDRSIVHLEKKIAEYARAHKGCCPPQPADEIIREFYGLGADDEVPAAAPTVMDFASFL